MKANGEGGGVFSSAGHRVLSGSGVLGLPAKSGSHMHVTDDFSSTAVSNKAKGRAVCG